MVMIESRTLVCEQLRVLDVQVGTGGRNAPVFQDRITASDPISGYPVRPLSLHLCRDVAQHAKHS
jgi:hypothetical protein